jgi:hypothetical protein
LQSLTEVSRRSNSLFKSLDELKQLAFLSSHPYEKDSLPNRDENQFRKGALSQPGIVLGSLTEFNIRNMCGAAVYGAGLQEYLQGRVSHCVFRKNTLWGKVDERHENKTASEDKPQALLPSITLERSSTRPKISGSCECTLAREGSLCPHMAALMIAWVRKPHEFKQEEDYQIRRSAFDEAKQRAEESLRELTRSIANGSSRKGDLQMLRKTYSKLKVWVREVNGVENRDGDYVREFLEVLNSVSFHLMYEIDRKYRDGAIADFCNRTIVSSFGKALESFVENTGSSKSTQASLGGAKRRISKKSSSLTASPRSSSPSRSWDSVVEAFFST